MNKTLLINGFQVEASFDDAAVRDIFMPFLMHLSKLHQRSGQRVVAFIAAPPATGKSTLAAFLQELAADMPGMPQVQAIGMDGFHYPQAYIASHSVLRDGKEMPMQRVKGAPESFDVQKLRTALETLRKTDILWSVYDRRLHDVVEDALHVTAPIVLVEGNYLLLDAPDWRDLPHDYAVFIAADESQLRGRLLARKMRGGATEEAALSHYETADGPNVRLCLQKHLPADLKLKMTGDGAYEKTI